MREKRGRGTYAACEVVLVVRCKELAATSEKSEASGVRERARQAGKGARPALLGILGV
jgi:hypothetical protein